MNNSLEHIQYLIDNYSTELLARLKSEGRSFTINQVMDTLLACDPSPGKKLTDWLVKTYILGGFLWEDIEAEGESKLAEVLGFYQTHFSQIPRDQRNIYDCQSYGELYRLVEPYLIGDIKIEDTVGSREIKRQERARALEESEVLYRSEDMIVAVPLTEMAAVWWGKGTKWCTAADKNNYFDHYNQSAPLIVITLMNHALKHDSSYPKQDSSDHASQQNSSHTGSNLDSSLENSGSQLSQNSGGAKKFQLWMWGSKIQFMDAFDKAVDHLDIEKHWNLFEPLFTAMIEVNPHSIYCIPYNLRSAKLCKRAVELSASVLGAVPDDLRTYEMYKMAIEEDGTVLSNIPLYSRTNEMYLWAVKQNGRALLYIPEELRTIELCWLAVEQTGWAIQFVPDQFKTSEICKLAVSRSPETLRLVPKIYRDIDPSFYMLAFEANAMMICHMPEGLKTKEIYHQAVEKSGESIFYVPVEYQTDSLKRRAIEQNGLALGSIHSRFRTFELCKLAVQQNINAFMYIPLKFKHEEFMPEYIQYSQQKNQVKKWDRAILEKLKKTLTHAFSNDQIKDNFSHNPHLHFPALSIG